MERSREAGEQGRKTIDYGLKCKMLEKSDLIN
jgi:hypothetical protein